MSISGEAHKMEPPVAESLTLTQLLCCSPGMAITVLSELLRGKEMINNNYFSPWKVENALWNIRRRSREVMELFIIECTSEMKETNIERICQHSITLHCCCSECPLCQTFSPEWRKYSFYTTERKSMNTLKDGDQYYYYDVNYLIVHQMVKRTINWLVNDKLVSDNF